MTSPLHTQLQRALGPAYRLDRELGGGGMSHVYVATEIALDREVVVKVLPAEMAGQVSVERFKREIALAARLQHPHIVPLLTAGDAEGLPYFTMPFVSGESLRARLVRQGELPLSEAVRLLREIASALAYAHERGIVHRDIKPDNVLLSGGSAMITDFGVAKALSASSNGDAGSMTSLGVALGTPAYMSPEQASADPAVDHRADIYAFGVLAYELLTGQPPFVGRTPASLLAAHVTEAPDHITKRRTAIPAALAALVMRCLEKRAADRPQSAAELVHALDAITTPSGGTQPTTAQLPYRTAAASPAPGRWRTPLIAVAAIVVVAIGAWAASRVVRPVAGGSRSIAVLPFDIGADTANAYLAEGLSSELTTKLSKIPGLTVRPYGSSKLMRGKSVRDAGGILNAGTVLTATLRRSSGQLRVNATLVNVADDAVLWSDSFDETADNQFALQDKIATAIASALRITLTPALQAAVSGGPRVSAESHDRVQQARFMIEQNSETSLRSAITILDEVTAKDSSYADAWAALVSAWAGLADDFVPPVQAIPHMRKAAARALALDPQLADAHTQFADLLFWYEWKRPEAEREYQTALRIDSTNVDALSLYPRLLHARLMEDSAERVALRAVRLNPSSLMALSNLEETPGAFRRISPDSGIAICRRLAMLGAELWAATCDAQRLAATGHGAAARERFPRTAFPSPSGSEIARAAWFVAELADTTATRALVAKAEVESRTRYVREDMIAMSYCRIGETEASIRWWKRAYASRSARTSSAWANCPMLRSDPRFRAAIGEENVPK